MSKLSPLCPQCGERMKVTDHRDVWCGTSACPLVKVRRCPLCERFEGYDANDRVLEVKEGHATRATRVRRGKVAVEEFADVEVEI